MKRRILPALSTRFKVLPRRFSQRPVRILDPGCGPQDASKARTMLPSCWYEGINIVPPPERRQWREAFDRYHVADLDDGALDLVSNDSYDIVFCSHTIEHLENGPEIVVQLCSKLRAGGVIYLEWPSLRSKHFPLRGLGLNFFDDSTHRATYSRKELADTVAGAGCVTLKMGTRRQMLRALFAIPLTIFHSFRVRRLVLFDFWDITGFCSFLVAEKLDEPSK